MSYSFPLERAFLAKEFSRSQPSELRVVGTLLDSAFVPPSSDEFEQLCARVETAAAH